MASALDSAIEKIGGPSATARAIGCTPQAVDQWKICPPGRVLSVERATEGAISRYLLRPDIYGVEPAAQERTR